MDDVLSTLKLAVGVLIAAGIISMISSLSDKGVRTFGNTTDDVTDSVKIMSEYSTELFDDKTVSYEILMTAVQDYAANFEIRYQTLKHKELGVEYVIYPGTEKDDHVAVGTSELYNVESKDYINNNAMWHVTVDLKDSYILFKQEKLK